MIVIIQCASTKSSGAGHLVTSGGRPIVFVAHPELAPVDSRQRYARPDDISDAGRTWRDLLLDYNRTAHNNPLGLEPAYGLYGNNISGRLVDKFGIDRVYVLSAGWGLIRSDFLTPHYDITFSSSARGRDAYKRRRREDIFHDFCMLPFNTEEEVLLFAGSTYLPLFCALTNNMKCTRTVFHRTSQTPDVPGCTPVRFKTTTRTNWQYECANSILLASE
jgi:hypothetical protein